MGQSDAVLEQRIERRIEERNCRRSKFRKDGRPYIRPSVYSKLDSVVLSPRRSKPLREERRLT